MDICPKCGLPLQACVCEEIAKTEQRIRITTEKKKFGKIITVISGFQDVDLKTIAKDLKTLKYKQRIVRSKKIYNRKKKNLRFKHLIFF